MSAPGIERLIAHGWLGQTSNRFISITTHGWYPPVSGALVDVLADPLSFDDSWMPYIAIGESNAYEDLVTCLVEEIHRKAGDVWANRNTLFIKAMFGLDEPNGDDFEILEVGIFDDSLEGNMAVRWILNTAIEKDNLDDIDIECAVTILHR